MLTLETNTEARGMQPRTALLTHQHPAIEKLLPIRVGALFMEMGTGKSRTAIEMGIRRQEKLDHIVWFCPVSLKETIKYEILKHTDCSPEDIHVFDDKTSEDHLPRALWYVIGLESMGSSNRVVLTVNGLITENTFVIVDESSYIKGHDSKRTQRITRLSEKARYRLILTGTPISQGVVDLFSQMRFLSPQILGYRSFYSFAANHLEYSERFPGMIVRSHNLGYIAAKIKPYVYQVTKDECLDLPDKLYETRYVPMSGDQWGYYQQAKDEILMQIDEYGDPWQVRHAIFRVFTALQQITCGFWNRHRRGHPVEHIEIPHNRLPVLMDTVTSVPGNEKVIIWAKYQHNIDQIAAALRKQFGEDSVAVFDGRLSEKQRARQLEKFRAESRFFLSTQSCGGHGLTLNESHYVIFYNNAFKYSERLQAEDRCHRIGQQNKVVYVDLRCHGTIDDRIAAALETKGNAVEAFKRRIEKVKDEKVSIKELIKNL